MSMSLSSRPSTLPANPTRQQLDELDALLQRMLELPVTKSEGGADTQPDNPPVSYTTPEAETPSGPAERIDFQALKERLAAHLNRVNDLQQATPPPPAEPAPSGPADAEENWVPLSSTWRPSSLTWKPLARSWQQPPAEPAAAPAPRDLPREMPAWEPSLPTPAAPAAAARALPSDAPTPASSSLYPSPEPSEAVVPSPRAVNEHVEPPLARWAMPLVWCNDLCDWPLARLGVVGRALRSRTGRLGLGVLGLACLVAAAVIMFIDWIGWTS